ncbi:hypothetical protein GCM10025734_79770 [Kitasatospora paranensis]
MLAQARRTWRRLGVPRQAAGEMAEELAADLAAAAADGRSAAEYVGGDAVALARTWAAARGLVRPRMTLLPVAAAAVLGALPGGFTGLFWAFAPGSAFPSFLLGHPTAAGALPQPAWAAVALYLASAAAGYAGSLAAVSAVLRHRADPCRRPTVRALAAALPGVGALAAAGGIGLAGALDFQLSAFRPVCLVVVLVTAAGAAAVRAAVVLRAGAGRTAVPLP